MWAPDNDLFIVYEYIDKSVYLYAAMAENTMQVTFPIIRHHIGPFLSMNIDPQQRVQSLQSGRPFPHNDYWYIQSVFNEM